MTVDVYLIPASPPCRAVLMTAKYLNIPVNVKIVDLSTGEHLKPEFLKINPQHTVPTIDDNGFILWESRAIMTYLVNQYAKNSTLYPADPKQRALVDRMLNFDIGTLYKTTLAFFRPQIILGDPADPELEEAFKKVLGVLEDILTKTPYAAGQHITLADLSIFAAFSFAELKEYNYEAYPKVSAWIQKLKHEIPSHKEINEEANEQLKERLKQRGIFNK